MLRGLIIPVIIAIIMTNLISNTSMVLFFLEILVYIVVYVASMWVLGMNTYEKNLILEPLHKIIIKIKR